MNSPRSRTPVLIAVIAAGACLLLVLLVVIAAVVGISLYRSGDDDAAGGSDSSGTSLELPPGVAEDQPYLELSSGDGPVVDVYLDFACPHCAAFVEANGEDARTMAESGDITLRVHPRPMLDANTDGYSSRAANAAVCAYAADEADPAGTWFAAEEALMAGMENSPGMDDAELAQVVTDATGQDVADCLADGTYVPWIQDVVEPEALESTQGTPAIMIDGSIVQIDTATPGSLREAVDEA